MTLPCALWFKRRGRESRPRQWTPWRSHPQEESQATECVTEEGGGVDARTVHQEDPEEGLEEGDGVNREGLQRMGVARPWHYHA